MKAIIFSYHSPKIKRKSPDPILSLFFSLFFPTFPEKPLLSSSLFLSFFLRLFAKHLSFFFLFSLSSFSSFFLSSLSRFSQTHLNPKKTNTFISLLFSSSSLRASQKTRRWMKNIQTKKQRNFLKVLRMEMKKLSKFFFLETKTNNSNLISTSNSNTERFFFSNSISLSLSLLLFLCGGV